MVISEIMTHVSDKVQTQPDGGEAQAPMARAIIGGLISSNLITLLVVPTIYALFEQKKDRFCR